MATKTLLQRETKKKVLAQLESSLIELKSILGDKKFANRIKKAAKLLTEGLGKTKKEEVAAAPKKEKPATAAKPAAKKTVKKKAPTAVKAIAVVEKTAPAKTIEVPAKAITTPVKVAKAPVAKKKVSPAKK